MTLDHITKMKRYLLHYVDNNKELDESNYFIATDSDEAYRQATSLLDECDEYQMSEL